MFIVFYCSIYLYLFTFLYRYNDLYTNPVRGTKQEHRDLVLDVLSDARVVGPLIQTGLYHADLNQHNYMYVFGHNSHGGPHANVSIYIAIYIYSGFTIQCQNNSIEINHSVIKSFPL